MVSSSLGKSYRLATGGQTVLMMLSRGRVGKLRLTILVIWPRQLKYYRKKRGVGVEKENNSPSHPLPNMEQMDFVLLSCMKFTTQNMFTVELGQMLFLQILTQLLITIDLHG